MLDDMVLTIWFLRNGSPRLPLARFQAFVSGQADSRGLTNVHNKLHSQDKPYNSKIDVKEVELFPRSAI
jgi:hypothetical protein